MGPSVEGLLIEADRAPFLDWELWIMYLRRGGPEVRETGSVQNSSESQIETR
jgi:hypothetical protein